MKKYKIIQDCELSGKVYYGHYEITIEARSQMDAYRQFLELNEDNDYFKDHGKLVIDGYDLDDDPFEVYDIYIEEVK